MRIVGRVASFVTGGIFSFLPGIVSSLAGIALGICLFHYDSSWTLLAAAVILTSSLIIPGIFMISNYPSRV